MVELISWEHCPKAAVLLVALPAPGERPKYPTDLSFELGPA